MSDDQRFHEVEDALSEFDRKVVPAIDRLEVAVRRFESGQIRLDEVESVLLELLVTQDNWLYRAGEGFIDP